MRGCRISRSPRERGVKVGRLDTPLSCSLAPADGPSVTWASPERGATVAGDSCGWARPSTLRGRTAAYQQANDCGANRDNAGAHERRRGVAVRDAAELVCSRVGEIAARVGFRRGVLRRPMKRADKPGQLNVTECPGHGPCTSPPIRTTGARSAHNLHTCASHLAKQGGRLAYSVSRLCSSVRGPLDSRRNDR
jgi:hypothetical protein